MSGFSTRERADAVATGAIAACALSFNNRIGRFDVFTAAFTFYPVALNDGVDDVAVAGDGTVWFIGSEVTEMWSVSSESSIQPSVSSA